MASAEELLVVNVAVQDHATNVVKGIESSIIRFVGAVSSALSAIAVVTLPIKNAAEFQRELINVQKTTEFTAQQISKLSDELIRLSLTTDKSAIELAQIAAIAGQLGIRGGPEAIAAFADTASRFASVLDVTVEEAGNGIARLSNIFKIGVQDAEKLGSLLNEVSNNSTASGRDLLDVMSRIGTAGGILNAKQAAALAATGRDLGLTLETIGTSFNKIFLDLQSKADQVAALVGMSVTEWTRMLNTDGIKALKTYLEALAKLPDAQRAALSEDITGGGRLFALVTNLVNDAATGYSVLNKNLSAANEGFDTGTSAIKEQQRVLSGVIAQFAMLKNAWFALSEAIGADALPRLTEFVTAEKAAFQDPATVERLRAIAGLIGWLGSKLLSLVEILSTHINVFTGVSFILFSVFALKAARSLADMVLRMSAARKEAIAARAAFMNLAEGIGQVTGSAKGVQLSQSAAWAGSKLGEKASPFFNAKIAVAATSEALATFEKDYKARVATWNATMEAQRVKAEALTQQYNAMAVRRDRTVAAMRAAGESEKAIQNTIRGFNNGQLAPIAKELVALGKANQFTTFYAREYGAELAKQLTQHRLAAQEAKALEAALTLQQRAWGRVVQGIGLAVRALDTFSAWVMRVTLWLWAIAIVLNIVGLLDPLMDKFGKYVGYVTAATDKAKREAFDRKKAYEEELRVVGELAQQYDQYLASRDKGVAKAPVIDNSSSDKLASSMKAMFDHTLLVGGHLRQMRLSLIDNATETEQVATRMASVKRKVEEVSEAIAKLKARQNDPAGLFGVSNRVTGETRVQKELVEQQEKLSALKKEEELLSLAQVGLERKKAELIAQQREDAAEQAKYAAQLSQYSTENGERLVRGAIALMEAKRDLKNASKDYEQARQRGDASSSDSKVVAKYIALREAVGAAEIRVQALNEGLKAAKAEAATQDLNFFNMVVPSDALANLDKTKLRFEQLKGISEEQARAAQLQLTELERQYDRTEAKIARVRKAKAEADAALAVPIKAPEGVVGFVDALIGSGGRLGLEIGSARAADEITSLLKENAERAKGISLLQDKLALRRVESTLGVKASQDETQAMRLYTKELISNLLTYDQLGSHTLALQRKAEASAVAATQMKSKFQQAVTDLASLASDKFKQIETTVDRIATRRVTLQLAVYDATQARLGKQIAETNSEIVAEERRHLEQLGYSNEEIAREIKLLENVLAKQEEIRKGAADEQRQRQVVEDADRRRVAVGDEINSLIRQANDLKREQDGLDRKSSDYADKDRELGERRAVIAEKLQIKMEQLAAATKKVQEEGSKLVGAFEGGFKFIKTEEELRQLDDFLAKAQARAKDARAATLKDVSDAYARAATGDQVAQQAAEGRLKEINKQLEGQFAHLKGLGDGMEANREALIKALKGMAPELEVIRSSFESIAKAASVSGDGLKSVKELKTDFEEAGKTIEKVSTTLAEKVVTPATTQVNVVASLFNELGATLAKAPEQISAATKAKPIDVNVGFPNARSALEEAMRGAQAEVSVSGAGIAGRASGGLVRGPGTGISDSILSWLSNGEYVIDAMTTSFFGSGFFSMLQGMARTGASPYSLAGLMLQAPRMAAGGPVGSAVPSPAMDTVEINFNVGGSSAKLFGPRDQVRVLTDALNKLNRG